MDSTKRGYLLWDTGFGIRFFLSLLVLGLVAAAAASSTEVQMTAWMLYQDLLLTLMDGANRLAWWSAIGLLSSSCCALQLMLNALNFGCAGFNTVLGPLRPSLCALTVCLQAAVWYTAIDKPFQLIYVMPCTAFAAVLTLLPEVTYLWVSRKAPNTGLAGSSGGQGSRSSLHLSVDGMGCVACTKKVAEVLDSVPQIISREVLLEAKKVKAFLSVEAEEARRDLVPNLLQRISDSGFKAELAEIQDLDGAAAMEVQKATDQVASTPLADASCCEASLFSGGGLAGLPMSIGAGLLSSSCCLLQLGVNLLATLNLAHVLGPLRPYLRVLTGLWLLVSWVLHFLRQRPAKVEEEVWQGRKRRGAWRLGWRTLLCLVLTFLPEALLWTGGPGLAPAVEGAEVLKVKVDGMGCEACQVHVQSVMDRMGGVVSSHVDFASGQAELVVNRGWNFDMSELSRRLEADGYSASPLTSPILKGASVEL
eukprot:TRINITY_DN38429_c0_g1_i1.p1 TRINITY_DN38429_c0_g1~~TRINITY_DN38429_c0_g1_i1.p1  ORF type:complete len:479 (-),score=107.12 TRINITY_DN38429_c0_g1_i1:48-1484(-)